MVPGHLGVSPEDSDPTPEEILAQHDQYIVALVTRRALRSTNFAKPGQFDLEVDEMAQRVRIKFWQALKTKHVEYPKAYLSAIVWNEFHDLSRKPRQPLPLFTNEDGEWYAGDEKELDLAWEADPADQFEESESLDELMDLTASALAKLAPRQQQAMICDLYEKIDTTLQFIEALREHCVDVKTVAWPENIADKTLLKASLSPARHKMAKHMEFDIQTYREKM
jgi:DNA-directed RNA polymerase specialized sigma24 family protein